MRTEFKLFIDNPLPASSLILISQLRRKEIICFSWATCIWRSILFSYDCSVISIDYAHISYIGYIFMLLPIGYIDILSLERYISSRYPLGDLRKRCMKYYIHTPKQLSSALKGRRRELQRTQHEVANSVGMLQKTVSKLENHVESSSVENLLKLISALGYRIILEPRDSILKDTQEMEWWNGQKIKHPGSWVVDEWVVCWSMDNQFFRGPLTDLW